MAKRKKRKNKSNGKWKIILFALLVIAAAGYFMYSGKDISGIVKNTNIERTFDYAAEKAGKITENIVSKTKEDVGPVINQIKDKIEGQTNNDTEDKSDTSSDNVIKLNLEIPVYSKSLYQKEFVLKRTGYTVSYNPFYKNPNWVAWELTREETKGGAERTDRFVPDPDLPEPRAQHSDYTRSGYDRGHMAPAADMKWSKTAMKESFYMSNICPQVGNLNRGDWNDLEETCRNWAAKYGTVYISCGPIFDTKSPKRIGKNKVGIPDRFFKVVLIYNRKNPMAMGFVFDNKPRSQHLKKYMVTVDSIEKITGLDFFSKLPDNIENKIEAEIPSIL